MPPTTDPISSSPSSAPSARSDASARLASRPGASGRGLCVFDLPGGRFGLDVQLVGEVIPIDVLIAVPRAPRGVDGLFNLRGLPVALIDLAIALDMPVAADPAPGAELIALVLRSGQGVIAAARVTAVRGVIPPAAAVMRPADRAADHAAIVGFVSTPTLGVVSVLDGAALSQRLAKFRFR